MSSATQVSIPISSSRRKFSSSSVSAPSPTSSESHRFTIPEELVNAQKTTPDRSFLVNLDPIGIEDVSEMMMRTVDVNNASQPEVNKYNIHQAIKKFQRFPGDTGSSEVQIAVLTEKIMYMEDHLRANRQDKHSRRGLVAMVSKRNRLMKYLRKKDFATYKEVLYQLNLKDVIREKFDYPTAKQPAKRKPGKHAPPAKAQWGTKLRKQKLARRSAK
eukprot:g869.t1